MLISQLTLFRSLGFVFNGNVTYGTIRWFTVSIALLGSGSARDLSASDVVDLAANVL